MKFTISRDALRAGLDLVRGVVPAKFFALPVLGNVLLEASSAGLRLAATDLDLSIETSAAADVDTEGGITLPAKRLVEIAKELPDGPVRFGFAEQRVGIDAGRSKFKLLGLPREEFPLFPAVKFDGSWKAPAGTLHALVERVAFAASTEESRPILNGVLWEMRPERMRMVATNGHRLARMDVPSQGGSIADIIVPPKALEQMRRLFPADAGVETARRDNLLALRSASTTLVTRLIEGPYPAYESVLPKANDKVATVDRAELTAALRRMRVVASSDLPRVVLAFGSEASVKVSTSTPDTGGASDAVPVRYEGEPLEIGFNVTYLLEALGKMPTDEVRLTFKTASTAATIEPVGWDDPAAYLVLLMPLRLD